MNGFIVKWGQASVTGSDSSRTDVIFNIDFSSSTAYQVVGIAGTGYPRSMNQYSPNTAHQFYLWSSATTIVHWISIGQSA